MCGQLHCTPAETLASFQSMQFRTIDSHITVGGVIYECDAAIIDVGTQYTDPGLAPDGAKCGDGKVLFYYNIFTVSNVCPLLIVTVVASRTSKQEGPGSIPGGGKEV